jgi:hypothetical protein
MARVFAILGAPARCWRRRFRGAGVYVTSGLNHSAGGNRRGRLPIQSRHHSTPSLPAGKRPHRPPRDGIHATSRLIRRSPGTSVGAERNSRSSTRRATSISCWRTMRRGSGLRPWPHRSQHAQLPGAGPRHQLPNTAPWWQSTNDSSTPAPPAGCASCTAPEIPAAQGHPPDRQSDVHRCALR